jgi:hypothetical protein
MLSELDAKGRETRPSATTDPRSESLRRDNSSRIDSRSLAASSRSALPTLDVLTVDPDALVWTVSLQEPTEPVVANTDESPSSCCIITIVVVVFVGIELDVQVHLLDWKKSVVCVKASA